MEPVVDGKQGFILATSTDVALLQKVIDVLSDVLDLQNGQGLSINARLQNVIGQTSLPNGPWRMSNYQLAIRQDATDLNMQQMSIQINSLNDALNINMSTADVKFETVYELLGAERKLTLARELLLQNQLDIQTAKLDLQDEAIEQLEVKERAAALLLESVRLLGEENGQQGELTRALLAETVAKQATDEARLRVQEAATTLLQQQQAQTVIQQQLLAAQQAQNQLALTKAQSDLQASLASIATTQANQVLLDQRVVTAQATADAATRTVNTVKDSVTVVQQNLTTTATQLTVVTARVDAAVTNIANLQASLLVVQGVANAAKDAVAALEAKGRAIVGVVVPAVSILGSGTQEVTVPISPPMTNNLYAEAFTQTSGPLGVTSYSIKAGSKTASSFVLVRSNTGTLTLAAPPAVVDIILSKA